MKRLLTIAAVLLASSAAHAGDSYSFEIGGRTIHIEAPSDCDSPSCVSVSSPACTNPARSAATAPATMRPNRRPRPTPRRGRARAAGGQSPSSRGIRPTGRRPHQSRQPPTTTAAAPPPTPVAAAAPPAAEPPRHPNRTPCPPPDRWSPPPRSTPRFSASRRPPPRQPAGESPLGIWQTEKKEGLVRIEACGANLCGYSVDARTNANGEKVLINMRPVSDTKWSGRIHDPKSGGNYNSTIALKGADTLRVQGCAFGGMFCGGQTWSRVN